VSPSAHSSAHSSAQSPSGQSDSGQSASTAGAAAATTGGAGRIGSVEVVLQQLTRHYGHVRALDGLDLRIAPGELVALLGPSGCGKTTALRILAGLEQATSGRVLVGGTDQSRVPANKRDMGMVFQAYSLFPHMTVAENVAFGLKLRGRSRAQRDQRASEMLELVGLGAHRNRYAHQLSGGQQQRVALARALAIEPSVLLLDEPLSALDAKVRTQLRDEIRRVQLEVGTTTLFVTHDQEEALAIADRVGVMSQGRLDQIAPPTELYAEPRTRFVAEFVGLTNRLPARRDGDVAVVLGCRLPRLGGSADGADGVALVRPEAVRVERLDGAADGAGDAAADRAADGAGVRGRVTSRAFLGPVSRVSCDLADGSSVTAQVSGAQAQQLPTGEQVRVSVEPVPVLVVPAD
jgi:putative spermidine/putrescine transport system ATP-binding protein